MFYIKLLTQSIRSKLLSGLLTNFTLLFPKIGIFLNGEFGPRSNPLPLFGFFFFKFQNREQAEFHNLFLVLLLVHILAKIYEILIYQL